MKVTEATLKKLKNCHRCKAVRRKEEEGQTFSIFKEGTDEILEVFWNCSKHSIQEEIYG